MGSWRKFKQFECRKYIQKSRKYWFHNILVTTMNCKWVSTLMSANFHYPVLQLPMVNYGHGLIRVQGYASNSLGKFWNFNTYTVVFWRVLSQVYIHSKTQNFSYIASYQEHESDPLSDFEHNVASDEDTESLTGYVNVRAVTRNTEGIVVDPDKKDLCHRKMQSQNKLLQWIRSPPFHDYMKK